MTPLMLLALTASAGPLSPEEERKTFHLQAGYRAELVAAEPDVVDPVSCCFDHRGRLFVCEMRGYPNGGRGTGNESRGRIRMLTDTDGDGKFETAVTFADGLRFPMGVVPWKTGVLVAVAPDLIFLDDTDGDGKADVKKVLYTGFDLANIQQLANSVLWQPDGWVYGVAGNAGGTITSAEISSPPVNLRGRGFRFRPDKPGSLEPTSGGGQYGLTADDFGHWFTATNNQHLRQIVVPDHYLRANPKATMPATTIDIAEHGAACKVFRLSPFEDWRVERTTRRAGGTDAKKFASQELVPGGYATSACSPLYRDGSVFVCDPANNLVIRDTLHENGAVFTARRAEPDRDFLASTDNWFRPVHLSTGPDGAMYMLDFYREVIETPLSLPDDIKAKLNLESRERGRIWRITTGERGKLPSFENPVERLTDANPWTRTTAARLLIERKSAADAVIALVEKAKGTPQLATLLATAAALGKPDENALLRAMADPLAGNREVAVRLAESRFADSNALRLAAVERTADPSTVVRFQLALSAGRLPERDRREVLRRLLTHNADEHWVLAAVLFAGREDTWALLYNLLESPSTNPAATRSAIKTVVAAANPKSAEALMFFFSVSTAVPGARLALLDGLTQLADAGRTPLLEVLDTKLSIIPGVVFAIARAELANAEVVVKDESAALDTRLSAANILGPLLNVLPALLSALDARHPPALQSAAARAVARLDLSQCLPIWPAAGPAARREIAEQMLAKPARVKQLIDALAAGTIRPAELDTTIVARLKAMPAVRERAEKLFAATNPNRKAVIDKYAGVNKLAGDVERGRVVFKAQCASCHKLGGDGHEVGPNLLAAVGGKSADDLLAAVLDPNREVDSRYLAYKLSTTDGRTLVGVLADDGAGSVTLRRADGVDEVVRRADVESLRSTGQSLMPEGLEAAVNPQQMADVFAFIRRSATR